LKNRGYKAELFAIDKKIAKPMAPRAILPEDTIDLFEWQTTTTFAANSVFIVAYKTVGPPQVPGESGQGQKLGTLSFGAACQSVFDPYGIVYDKASNKPIAGVDVTLLQKNKSGKLIEVKNQELTAIENHIVIINPQKTDSRGNYSFFVPDGTYYIKAVSNGYKEYVSGPITQLGKPVRVDIFLEKN
jgi:hypothetical protein